MGPIFFQSDIRQQKTPRGPILDYDARLNHWSWWRRRLSSIKVWCVILFCLATCGSWKAWQWRIQEDEKAFSKRGSIDSRMNFVDTNGVPDAASFRHISRLPGEWSLRMNLWGAPDVSHPNVFRGRWMENVVSLHIVKRDRIDEWIKQDVGFRFPTGRRDAYQSLE